ncbi:MAG: hypothetical protein GTN88_15110, partial [Gammaproteobacteria bacterium]|nr:hypothetical protein [Gammaproteobacteria bacterium]
MLSAITMLAANGQARGPRADGLVLQRINEVRRTDLVKDENGFSLDQPGLVLTWGIKVPEGRRVVALAADPRAIRATDSTGR